MEKRRKELVGKVVSSKNNKTIPGYRYCKNQLNGKIQIIKTSGAGNS